MKSQTAILLFLISFLTFSCTDNITDIGSKIQPSSDSITVGTDIFNVSTENVFVESMYSRADSFLLGTFYNEKYGTTQADILAQLNCPIGYVYPPNSIPDSALVILYYKTWFGDSYSPLDVNIYQMNKKTFDYSGLYPTNLNPEDYTDRSIKLGQQIFTAKNASNPLANSNSVIFKLSNNFVQDFFKINSDTYSSESKFTDFFKGLFITANYGASTILNIRQIDLEYYFHYSIKKPGEDTISIVKNILTFPANKEVRQVNRFLHPDLESVKQKLEQDSTLNYISSPANIQTRVIIPLNKMKQRMEVGINNKKLVINSALLRVEATEVDEATLAIPIVSSMLLIKESAIVDFFTKNKLPSDTCAILSSYTSSLIPYSTTLYEDYYTFNLATLIANELKSNPAAPENLKMILVPVRVTSNSSGVVTAVKQQFLMSAVTVRSGKNTISPMRIKVVYSGF